MWQLITDYIFFFCCYFELIIMMLYLTLPNGHFTDPTWTYQVTFAMFS